MKKILLIIALKVAEIIAGIGVLALPYWTTRLLCLNNFIDNHLRCFVVYNYRQIGLTTTDQYVFGVAFLVILFLIIILTVFAIPYMLKIWIKKNNDLAEKILK